jgi:hypothetical protein
VGAGTGKLTGRLLALGLEVAAIEPDPAMLAVLRRERPGRAAVPGRAGMLPLPDASVDAVLAWPGLALVPGRAGRRRGAPGAAPGRLARPDLERAGPTARLGEHELAGLDPDTAGRDFRADPVDDPFEVAGLAADELEWATFPWLREIDGPRLEGRLRTHSAFAVLPEGERERLIEAMVAVLGAEAERRGTPTVPLRQRAHCARWRPT